MMLCVFAVRLIELMTSVICAKFWPINSNVPPLSVSGSAPVLKRPPLTEPRCCHRPACRRR